MSGRVVNQNSVQAQFFALNRDRDGLRIATNTSVRERRDEEDLLRRLRETQAALAEKIEATNATLGLETKKRQLLCAEDGRLNKVMKEEKNSIIELTSELEELNGEDRVRKVGFVKEMNSLNDELDSSLRQYEDRRIMRLLTEESISRVVFSRLNELGPGEGISQELSNKLTESFDLLKEAASKLKNEVVTKKSLMGEIHGMRAKMMRDQQVIFQDETMFFPIGLVFINIMIKTDFSKPFT